METEEQVKQLQRILQISEKTVFFTGAGVSTDSGIPDFRSKDGLYRQKYAVSPEEMISHHFFMQNTEEFYRFYKDRMLYPEAKPNAVHRFIASYEKTGKSLGVVTQNIDGLHQKAGSKKVFELHGSVLRNYCMDCGAFYPLSAVTEAEGIPRCQKCGGIIKPDVVLYEEGLSEDVLMGAVEAISQADALVVLGTSLVVYPAAGLLRYFRGNQLILINRDTTPFDDTADLVIHASFDSIFPALQAVEEDGSQLQ